MKKIMIAGMLIISCGAATADTVELGQKIYSDVLIIGISSEKIFFIQDERVKTERPLDAVTKLKIDLFPDFTRAEELASLSQYSQAMKQYLESYKKIKEIKTAWQVASDEYFENGKQQLADILAANAKSEWIKDLIKIRYAKAKSAGNGGRQQAKPQADATESETSPKKDGDNPSANADNEEACKDCRGKGKIKCEKCNGSGKIKCSHIVKTNNGEEHHSHYYEICPTCKGKGKLIEEYKVYIKGRMRGTKYIPGYESKRTRTVPCTNKKCMPWPKDPRIFVIWMCPLCATTTYPGYIDCSNCDKGYCTCSKCNGMGKISEPTTNPAK